MKQLLTIILLTALLAVAGMVRAQTFTPIAITGFNNDVVAETGNSAVSTTTTVIDGSNHVIYSQAFAAANGLFGGILNSGTFVSGTRTYQMAAYNGPNALYMSAAGNVTNSVGTGTLTLTTPGSFTRLSLLAFGTENNSTVSVTLNFTDGTSANAGTLLIKDWFDNNPFIFSGLGRLTRTTAPLLTVDGLPSNPRMYSFDFMIPCAQQAKLIQSVTFNYIQGPNISSRAVILALSGVSNGPPLTFTDAITDATCGSANGSIALTTSGGNTPLTYSWNSTPVQTTPTASNLVAGTYTCVITDVNNCPTSYTGTVTEISTAKLTASANPTAICPGETTSLTATATGGTVSNYLWTPNQATQAATTDNPAVSTKYIVSAKDALGCILKDSITVTVKPTPSSDFSVVKGTVCQGDPDTLLVTTPIANATYTWTGATVTGDPQTFYATTFNTAGTFNIQLQVIQDGCLSPLTTKSVTVSAPPVVSLEAGKSPLCAGDVTTITFTGSTSGGPVAATWMWDGAIVQSGSNLGPFNVQFPQSANITLSVTDGACTVTSAPLPVTAVPVPVAAFTPDALAGCTPALINFSNESQHADSYQWVLGDGSKSTGTAASHTYTAPGTYTVTLTATAQGLCSNTITKTALINIIPPPVAAFSANPGENIPTEFRNADFLFTNTSADAISYNWDFGDGTTSAETDPEHKYQLPGDYRVTLFVTNNIGCTDSISHAWYKVIPDLVLDIPNAFSPNGDGINDRWEIDGLKARPNATTEVYNRWGQIVYRSAGYAGGWDGTRQGKLLPAGTYYYIIKTAPDEKPYTGWVVLLR